MTRWEVDNLPLGQVFDQVACWQIAELGVKEKPRRPKGVSLAQQLMMLPD